MIARLRGRLDSTGEDWAVVDVGGVGYLVFCSARTLQALPRPGEPVDLHVETQVREDSIALFGFPDQAEREWFRLLQTVQGVGARHALALLTALTPERLAMAVAAQDRTALTRAMGVGPRLAARIVSELKDRVGRLPTGAPATAGVAAGGRTPAAPGPVPGGGAVEDAVSALVNLGYGRSDAYAAVLRAAAGLGERPTVDALIRAGLQELART
ncbi:MAG TPA: Holliday junction branch migration protein RuvA [Geminicoccaceae bacterium]|nr:Holliday junction branch migration protein RuvA [Geminicoccaceae bacterium]